MDGAVVARSRKKAAILLAELSEMSLPFFEPPDGVAGYADALGETPAGGVVGADGFVEPTG